MITLKEATEALAKHYNFNAGNLTAEWVNYYNTEVYVVKSYGVEIAVWQDTDRGYEHAVWASAYNHSKTTSKHANIVKRAWGLL